MGCKSTETGDGAGGGGGAGDGGSGVQVVGTTVAMSCLEEGPACDPPTPTSATVAATVLDDCSYHDAQQRLDVSFVQSQGFGGLYVNIEPFTGDGTYEVTADGLIDVRLDGEGIQSSAFASAAAAQTCSITVTSNFADITVPESGDAQTLDVVLDVSCSTVVAGGVCDVTCDLSPTQFSVSVGGCTVSL
jgi:hypothetical protein